MLLLQPLLEFLVSVVTAAVAGVFGKCWGGYCFLPESFTFISRRVLVSSSQEQAAPFCQSATAAAPPTSQGEHEMKAAAQDRYDATADSGGVTAGSAAVIRGSLREQGFAAPGALDEVLRRSGDLYYRSMPPLRHKVF